MSDSAKGHSPFPHAIPDVATARRCVDAVVEYLAGKDDSPRAAADLRESVRLLSQPGTWQPITGEMNSGWFVVTNNMTALYANGLKSHVWLTNFIQAASGEHGEFICYDDGDRCVRGLTHYQRLNLQPLPPAPVSDPKE